MEKKKFVLTDEWKQHAFTTPEGYFDTLQERVTARITGAPCVSWIAALRPQLAFAAGFVALVVAGYGGLFMLNNLKEDALPVAFEDENAITASILGIDEDMVLQAMSDNQVEEVATGDIINYLADAHISITDIASLE